MAREPKIRLVAFIPVTLADQYTALSKQSGLSRSELVRMALQRAHRSIVVWCEKHRDEFLGDQEGVVVGSGSDRKEAPSPSPVAQLTEYCRILVEQDPDLGVEAGSHDGARPGCRCRRRFAPICGSGCCCARADFSVRVGRRWCRVCFGWWRPGLNFLSVTRCVSGRGFTRGLLRVYRAETPLLWGLTGI